MSCCRRSSCRARAETVKEQQIKCKYMKITSDWKKSTREIGFTQCLFLKHENKTLVKNKQYSKNYTGKQNIFCATTCASIFSDSQLDDRIYNYLPWDSAESTVTWTSDKQSGQPVQTLSSHSPDPCPVRSKHHQNTKVIYSKSNPMDFIL